MEFVPLGNSDVVISRIGFGGCPMGQHGWGQTDTDDLMEAIDRALDLGVTLFDTADVYGLGASEKMLGEGLRGHRDAVVVATKFGVRVRPDGKSFYDNSADWIRTALDASLKRLATDRIDVYQLHYWDGLIPLTDTFDALERQREAGKIRYYGVSNIDLDPQVARGDWPGLVSFSDEYSLVNRICEPKAICTRKDLGLTFLSWGSLGQGVLSGKYDGSTEFSEGDRRSRDVYVNFHGGKFSRNLKIVEFLRTYCQKYDVGVAQLALRYILDKIPNSVALVGVKNPGQIEANCAATGWRYSAEDLIEISHYSDQKNLTATDN